MTPSLTNSSLAGDGMPADSCGKSLPASPCLQHLHEMSGLNPEEQGMFEDWFWPFGPGHHQNDGTEHDEEIMSWFTYNNGDDVFSPTVNEGPSSPPTESLKNAGSTGFVCFQKSEHDATPESSDVNSFSEEKDASVDVHAAKNPYDKSRVVIKKKSRSEKSFKSTENTTFEIHDFREEIIDGERWPLRIVSKTITGDSVFYMVSKGQKNEFKYTAEELYGETFTPTKRYYTTLQDNETAAHICVSQKIKMEDLIHHNKRLRGIKRLKKRSKFKMDTHVAISDI